MSTIANNEAVKVLLVEDNPDDAHLIREILKLAAPEQFDVTSVEHLPVGAAGPVGDGVDVILLGLSLPDATGLETVIRRYAAARHLPIVVLTGHNDETLAHQAIREGAQDYLLKHNLDSNLLKRVLRNAIERKRAGQVERESEERFRALVQHSTDIVTILAADGNVLYESPSLETIMGYRPEAVQGLNMAAFLHPDDLPALLDGMTTLLDQPAAKFCREGRVRHADGSWRTLEMTMTNLLDHPAIHGIVVNSHDVTERKRTEEALHFQAQLLNSVGQAVIATNLENKIVYWNRFAETLYGWSAAEALGRNVMDITPADTSHEQAEAIMTRLRAGESWHGEFTMQHRDGTVFPVLVTDTPILDENGTLMGLIGVSQDITERKHAEQGLQQYNRRLGILHNIDRGILTAQPQQEIAGMIAQSLSELIPCDAIRIIALDSDHVILPYLAAYPPASQESQDLLRQAIATYGLPERFRRGEALLIDDIQTYENLWAGFEEVLTRGNARSWIIVPLIAGEQLVGILVAGSLHALAFTPEHVEIAREVADQLAIALHKNHLDEQIQEHARKLEVRVAERTEQLYTAKERSDAILMSASDATIVATPEGSIEQVNTAFTLLFGYSPEQGRALSLFALLDSAGADTARRTVAELVTGSQAKRLELVSRRQDGTLFDADVAFIRVDYGHSTILICSIRDITERKQVSAELERQSSFLRNVIDVSPSLIFVKDFDGRFVLVNQMLAKLYDTTVDALIGKMDADFNPSLTEVDDYLEGDRRVIDSGEALFTEEPLTNLAGETHWLQTTKVPIISADGTSKYVLGVATDITERKRAEAELRQAWAKEKHLNEVKSNFVAMVSHDFRSPLAAIQTSSDLLKNYSDRMTDEKKQKHFRTINGQIEHLTDLLEDTLILTKAESVGMDFHPVGTDLELFCQALVDEMQPLAGTRTIQFVVAGPVEWVMLDPQLLRRVLVNLLSNAVKYSPEGSVIEFTVSCDVEQITLRIQDHGIGIPEEEQARLFEVFHRAKNVGDIPGTGLGLAIVKLAVDAHGGNITVDSQVNVGTAVTISLPLMLAEEATP